MLDSRRPGLRLSIVIAAWNGRGALEECLASLSREAPGPDTEVIVVSNFGASGSQRIRNRFPDVLHVEMPRNSTVPALRTAGINRAAGEIIALAEDHCTFGKSWCQR